LHKRIEKVRFVGRSGHDVSVSKLPLSELSFGTARERQFTTAVSWYGPVDQVRSAEYTSIQNDNERGELEFQPGAKPLVLIKYRGLPTIAFLW
jgi:hypothetical protein